jgi:hypothetical protein
MSGNERVLVVGSYPPIPLPASDAALAAVRRSWDEGHEVTVASPRSSAAHLEVPVVGPLAGHRLDNVRRVTQASRLILVVEDGVPIPKGPRPAQRLCAGELARSMRRFDHVTVVLVGTPAVAPAALRKLRAAADEVVEHPVSAPAPFGVTPAGPVEHSVAERTRALTLAAGRKVLGPRAPAVRARLAGLRRTAASAVHRI